MPTDVPREDETMPLPHQGRQASGPLRPPVRYRVVEEIARGGMGAVLRAKDPELDRVLAIKVLLEEHAGDIEMCRRFLEEARITSRLQHPGVVPVHDIGRFADGRPFFTMKLVQGRTFAALLAARASPADDQPHLLGVFEAVCQTIAYAHSRGVIHRDLKPSNVMVGAFGEVQVMDWGVAKVLRPEDARDHAGDTSFVPPMVNALIEHTLAGSVVGTPAYMAPEQARGEPLDERADVFGLGAILCEILTGKPPYAVVRGPSAFLLGEGRDLAEAHVRLEGCGADKDLATLARACLAEEPQERPANAGALAEALVAHRASGLERLRQAELERAGAEARIEAASARAAVEARARRLLAGLAAAVLLTVALAAFAGWWYREKQQASRLRVEGLLADSARLAQQADRLPEEQALERWREAAHLADQAQEAAQGGFAGADLRQHAEDERQRTRREVEQRELDRRLVDKLHEVRIRKEDDYDRGDAGAAYEAAFKAHGVDIDGHLPELALAIRARRPAVVAEVTAALDDWSGEWRREGKPPERWQRPMRLSSLVDDDPWRRGLRRLALDAPTPASRAGLALAGLLAQQPGPASSLPLLEAVLRRGRLLALAREGDPAQRGPASMVLLASQLRQEGVDEEAIKALRAAHQRHPGDLWVNYDLARLMQDRDPAEAVRFYTAARAVRSEIGHALGHVLSEMKREDEAAAVFRELVRQRPNNGTHRNCLAFLLARMGRHAEARPHYEEAARLEPTMHQPHHNLARSWLQQGEAAKALPHIEQALRLRPGLSGLHFTRGQALRQLEKLPAAEASFRRALELDASEHVARFHLAMLLEDTGRTDEAVRHYEGIPAGDARRKEAQSRLAIVLTERALKSSGVEKLRAAVERDPDSGQARLLLGFQLHRLGKPGDGLPHFRRAAELLPDNPRAATGLAIALLDLNRPDEALPWFKKAEALEPGNPSGPYNLGNCHKRRGAVADAVACYRRSLAINNEYPEAHCNLGHALRDLGQFADSLESFKLGHKWGMAAQGWGYPSAAWLARAEQLARAEKRLPGLLDGSLAPEPRAERLLAAEVCRLKGMHLGRARLLEEAMADDPARPDRMGAAVSAVLAANGKSADAAGLKEAERAKWRSRALAWLEAEADVLARRVRARDSEMLARAALRSMLRDPALATMRDAKRLASLPAPEAQRWAALWAAVRRILPEEA